MNITIRAVDNDALPTFAVTPLPTAMTAAAFAGIAWYLCIELNVRLCIRTTRFSLYLWSCLICSWAIILHLVFILLLDFEIYEDYAAVVFIHLTWYIYITAQSLVLYSRLNLVLRNKRVGSYVLYMIATIAIMIGLTTVVFGLVAVSNTFPNP